MRFDVHHHIVLSPEVSAHFDALSHKLDLIIKRTEAIMIDTSKILAEVARERTELASWKALSAAKDKVIADTASALKDALAANDPAAIAKVQADLDQAANDLKNDNDEAETAVKANVAKPA